MSEYWKDLGRSLLSEGTGTTIDAEEIYLEDLIKDREGKRGEKRKRRERMLGEESKEVKKKGFNSDSHAEISSRDLKDFQSCTHAPACPEA